MAPCVPAPYMPPTCAGGREGGPARRCPADLHAGAPPAGPAPCPHRFCTLARQGTGRSAFGPRRPEPVRTGWALTRAPLPAVKSIRSVPAYLAETLYYAMKASAPLPTPLTLRGHRPAL